MMLLRQLMQLEAYGVTTVMALGLNGPLFYELVRCCMQDGYQVPTRFAPFTILSTYVAVRRNRSSRFGP